MEYAIYINIYKMMYPAIMIENLSFSESWTKLKITV